MTGEPETTTATTAAQRAEDRTEGGSSRLLAWLLTPLVAVLPWWVTIGGLWMLARGWRSYAEQFQPQWGATFAGAAVLVLAALLWAAVTAWSSVGTTVAGLCTLALGVALGDLQLARSIYDLVPTSVGRDAYVILTPMNFLLFGSLLLAAGLGGAGARRLGRRRA